MTITCERVFNENETTREYGNRIYTGVVGWRWHPSIDGVAVGDSEGYRTEREAIAAASREASASVAR